MTNVQLLLSIGSTSVLVILAWLSNNTRLNRVQQQMDQRFRQVDQRLDRVIDANHRDALEIMRSMTALHQRVAVVEAKQNG